jgi:hypothetical protein
MMARTGGIIMQAITVRRLDSELASKLKQAAKKEGKSVNQFVLDAIKKSLGEDKEKRFTAVYHDMDHLFGKWSQEEFEKIQEKIDSERTIDKELWS